MEAAAEEIEAGNGEWVLAEVERLSGNINATYQGRAHIEAMDEAAERVRTGEGSDEPRP